MSELVFARPFKPQFLDCVFEMSETGADPRSSSLQLASALSMPGGAPVYFGEPFLFPELRLERATIFTRHALVVHCRLYISLATASARVHPARLPRASRRLARARVAAKFACARCSARLTELGVGWRSICAPIDCGANGPAFGFPADCLTASSNAAILALQGPACADSMLRPKAAKKKTVAIRRTIMFSRRCRRGMGTS